MNGLAAMKINYAMRVNRVFLSHQAQNILSMKVYQEVKEWLNQWTCKNNFKAVLCENREAGISELQADLRENLIPSWMKSQGVTTECFVFDIASADVKDGRFWSCFEMVSGTVHTI